MRIDDRDALWDALMKLPDDGHAMSRGVVLANGEHALAYFSCRASDELLLNLAVSRGDSGNLVTYTTDSLSARWQAYRDGREVTRRSAWPDVAAFPLQLAHDLAAVDEKDAENCGACVQVQDLCDYHRGVADGVDHLARAVTRLAEEPELSAALLAIANNPAGRLRGGTS